MIQLYHSASSPARKAAEAAIPSPLWATVEQHEVIRTKAPKQADLVLQVGKGSPSIVQERMARNLRAEMVCLPEANEYLLGRVIAASNSGKDLVLVDAGLATSRKVFE